MKYNNNTHTKRYSSEISTEPTLHYEITQVRFNSGVKPPGPRFSHAHIRSERKSSRSLEPEFWRVQLSSRSSFIINACPDGATQRDTQTAKHPHTLVQTVWSHHSLSGHWWEKLQRRIPAEELQYGNPTLDLTPLHKVQFFSPGG